MLDDVNQVQKFLSVLGQRVVEVEADAVASLPEGL